jgi:hypothetical protein
MIILVQLLVKLDEIFRVGAETDFLIHLLFIRRRPAIASNYLNIIERHILFKVSSNFISE